MMNYPNNNDRKSNSRIRRRNSDNGSSSNANSSPTNDTNDTNETSSSFSSYYYPQLPTIPLPPFYNPMSSSSSSNNNNSNASTGTATNSNHGAFTSNYNNNDNESNLVPIWALAAVSVHKKQSLGLNSTASASTGISSSHTNSTNNSNNNSNNNNNNNNNSIGHNYTNANFTNRRRLGSDPSIPNRNSIRTGMTKRVNTMLPPPSSSSTTSLLISPSNLTTHHRKRNTMTSSTTASSTSNTAAPSTSSSSSSNKNDFIQRELYPSATSPHHHASTSCSTSVVSGAASSGYSSSQLSDFFDVHHHNDSLGIGANIGTGGGRSTTNSTANPYSNKTMKKNLYIGASISGGSAWGKNNTTGDIGKSRSRYGVMNLNRVLSEDEEYDHTTFQSNSSMTANPGTATTGTNMSHGTTTSSSSNSGISKSEFSQEKKWIRSGHKWVLTETNSSINSSSASNSTNNNRGMNSLHTNKSNSSLWTAMGQTLPTVHSMESNSMDKTTTNSKSGAGSTKYDPPSSSKFTNVNHIRYPSSPIMTKASITTQPTTVNNRHHYSQNNKSLSSNSSNSAGIGEKYSSTPKKQQQYLQNSNYPSIITSSPSQPQQQQQQQQHTPSHNTNSSSVISSSPSLLYARRRLAITPCGFPYMPSLHLTRSSSSLGGSGTAATSKDINTKSNLPIRQTRSTRGIDSGGATSHDQYDNNNELKVTENRDDDNDIADVDDIIHSSGGHNDNSSDNTNDDRGITQSFLTSASTTGSTATLNPLSTSSSLSIQQQLIKQNSTVPQPQHQNDDFSGYDSESNTGERLKEWKEKYVKNAIPKSNQDQFKMKTPPLLKDVGGDDNHDEDNDDDPIHGLLQHERRMEKLRQEELKKVTSDSKKDGVVENFKSKNVSRMSSPQKLSQSTRAYSDSFRSIYSDYDSETNERLTEWKKEQYRKTGIILDSSKPILSNKGHGHRQKSPKRPSRGVVDYAKPYSPVHNFDTGYESGATEKNARLKEWKEQQYQSLGIVRKKKCSDVDTTVDGLLNHRNDWDIPSAASLDSCDSEEPSAREERIMEWKNQFTNLPKQVDKRVLGGQKTKDQDNGKATIGFFPVTSPVRESRPGSPGKKSNRGLPPNASIKSTSLSPPPLNAVQISKGNHGKDVINSHHSNSSNLPPLTPPRTMNRVTHKNGDRMDGSSFEIAMSSNDKSRNDNIQTMDEKNGSQFSSSILCSPSDGVIGAPCQVIPNLPSTDSALDVDGNKAKKSSLPILRSDELWNPVRSQSSFSAITGTGDYDSSCSLNPHDKKTLISLRRNKAEIRLDQSSELIHCWENCLYVRAEGARTGKICLSYSHLIFLYDDDVAEAAIFENKWDKKKIDEFLHGDQSSPTRSVTPMNVPLKDSKEGYGVELIGEGELHETSFLEMLEDGFYDLESCTQEGKENCTDITLGINEIKCNAEKTMLKPVHSTDTDIDHNGKMSLKDSKGTSKARKADKDVILSELSQNSVSISPSYSSTLSDDSLTKDETSKWGLENSFCEDSYEHMLNECIVRAMKAEAHRRLTDASRDDSGNSVSVASHKYWEKVDMNRSELHNDFGSLLGNQTNVSSFSEPDLEIDPDEERRLYISCSQDFKNKYVGIKWSLSELCEVYDRRYMTKEVALEIFRPSQAPATTQSIKKPSSGASVSTSGGITIEEVDVPLGPLSTESVFLVIPNTDGSDTDKQRANRQSDTRGKHRSRRDEFVDNLKTYAPNINDVHWQNAKTLNRLWSGNGVSTIDEEISNWTPTSFLRRKHKRSDSLHTLTRAWRKGFVSNYDYLLRLNAISGRSFHDPGNYPVMPWVLSNFVSSSVPNLSDERNYRDLTKPMGALCPERLEKFLDKYASLCSVDYAIPPFMYGSHYSNTGGVVLHYLVRKKPFAGLHRQLQVSFVLQFFCYTKCKLMQ